MREKMKEQKATRQLDELGRLVIPADIRESLGWGTGTKLGVEINDITVKSIIVREVSPCCSLCRAESEDLVAVEKGYICKQCVGKVK
ncbi:MAG: AbrB/MazE/SpoVT family DNA-binding domain-containing protein [Oscillospiraceae bacterium]|nr:AbrB/MazE/SpoVT family DNA-binding domain-containing protein [Oscillospiraceae bacterium]